MARAGGASTRPRISLSGRTGSEISRVLGGGVVPGALVLIGGDPGVGKSTMMLQIAGMVAHPELDFDAIEDKQDAYNDDIADGDYDGRSDGAGPLDLPLEGMDGTGDGLEVLLLEHSERGTAAAGGDDAAGTSSLDEEAPGSQLLGEVSSATGAGEEGSGRWVADRAAPVPPSSSGRTVMYITAEETRQQVVDRAVRMGLADCDNVTVMAQSEVKSIVVVLDSINTVYIQDIMSAPGSVVQIRECGQGLMRLAKDFSIAIFIIGHVTKAGDMAGPNTLAHMVDTVLYMEGDDSSSLRLLRAHKNRHGPSDEVGIFRMGHGGMSAMPNYNAVFLESRVAATAAASGRRAGASSIVGVTLQGNRALLGEVQALCSPMHDRGGGQLYRNAPTSIDKARLSSLCMILDKNVPTLDLYDQAVLVNVVGGVQMKEVAADLALAIAIASSYYNAPVPPDMAACGEVDLSGFIRSSFKRMDLRLAELHKMGFKRVIIPRTGDCDKYKRDRRWQGLEVIAVEHVEEALRTALGDVIDHRPANVKPPPRSKQGAGTEARRAKQGQGPRGGGDGGGGGDASWQRGAAVGGVTAAYAAAAAAPWTSAGLDDEDAYDENDDGGGDDDDGDALWDQDGGHADGVDGVNGGAWYGNDQEGTGRGGAGRHKTCR